MAVSDRWHTAKPRLVDGELVSLCKEHKQFPSVDHGAGDRWQVRWRDEDGKQRKQNFARKTGKDSKKCADAFDAKVQAELDAGTYVSPADANTTFKKYAEDWRKARTHDVTTAARVERQFRLHVYPAVGKRTLRELARRPTLIQAWISGMKGAASSVNQIISDTSSVFNAAVDDGLITRNPIRAKSVQRPTVVKERPVPWTFDQVKLMARTLPERYAVLPYLGAGTGMRQGELFGLALDDVDFLRRIIHVRRQVRRIGDKLVFASLKNNKIHEVPLTESVAVALSEHIREYPPVVVTLPLKTLDGAPVTHNLILTRPGGLAMHNERFDDNVWNPARRKAGIKDDRRNGCHALRHTAASAWLSAGVDIVTVAAYLGDTVKTVFDYYAHMMPDADDRARKAMERFFAEASAQNVPSEGAL